jgi:hypothetical protein
MIIAMKKKKMMMKILNQGPDYNNDVMIIRPQIYEVFKNANDIPTQCPAIDDISYSTLGSPIDATPITPGPILDEI